MQSSARSLGLTAMLRPERVRCPENIYLARDKKEDIWDSFPGEDDASGRGAPLPGPVSPQAILGGRGRTELLDDQLPQVHINLHWGHSGHCSGFFLLRNIERVLQHLEPTIRAGDSAEEFEAFFGKAYGRQILDAARLVADVPLEINSILYLEREGFTFNMPPWFDGLWRWPGVLGDPRFDPPSWTNTRGSRTLTQLMEEAASRLLAEGTLLVKQVTDRLGYRNPNDFSRAFRRFFGVPPTDHATKLKRHSEI
jgi:AraC-like DNA-binding protein